MLPYDGPKRVAHSAWAENAKSRLRLHRCSLRLSVPGCSPLRQYLLHQYIFLLARVQMGTNLLSIHTTSFLQESISSAQKARQRER